MIEFVNQWERHMIYETEENQFSLITVVNNKIYEPKQFNSGFAFNASRTIMFLGQSIQQSSILF